MYHESRSNKIGLVEALTNGVNDRLTRVFKGVSLAAFALVPLTYFLSNQFPNMVIWDWLLAISFFTGPIMLVCAAARAKGIQQGIHGFGRQLLAVFGKAAMFIFLPALLVTLLLIIYMWQAGRLGL